MTQRSIGQSLPRDEDARLITGAGRYTDDIRLDNEAHMVVVRSDVAAGRIGDLDIGGAADMPGVLAVLTAKDMEEDGLGNLRPMVRFPRPDGSDMADTPYGLLARGEVRHLGEPVAVVIAESRSQAEDAAETVFVDYETGDAVTHPGEAARDGEPRLWPDVANNVAFELQQGDAEAVARAFKEAHHVARLEFRITRVTANTMEPRAMLGRHDPQTGRMTLWAGTQQMYRVRQALAEHIFHIPQEDLQVISPDVGGSFGMKNSPSREMGLVLWAARRVGRPVRWCSTRSEGFLADYQGRDNQASIELALDADGTFLAIRLDSLAGIGAYLAPSSNLPPTQHHGGLAGVYRTPHIHVRSTGVLTNTMPLAPYRGAGRPEATYALERVIDLAAGEMGLDRVEIRRKNLIQPDEMPYKTGLVFTYDCGDFPRNMDMVLEAADWAGFAARKEAARQRGRLAGISIVNAIEIASGPHPKPLGEFAEIRFEENGDAVVYSGLRDAGMGHETVFRQMAGELLGLEAERFTMVVGDTDRVRRGEGTFGSRSMGTGGHVFAKAAREVIERGRALAARHLEVAEGDVEFVNAAFTVKGTDRAIGVHDLAATEPGALDVELYDAPDAPTFPNGAHVCEVEVDPETGVVEITRYAVVDDVGTVINPLLVKGQVRGGVAQGAGQALGEALVYEQGSGQLLSGSFMDYPMPRADDLPVIDVLSNPVPTQANLLGAKGAGEAGTVGALAAVMNAIIDALADLGIRHLDMPATPQRVWRAIREASADGSV